MGVSGIFLAWAIHCILYHCYLCIHSILIYDLVNTIASILSSCTVLGAFPPLSQRFSLFRKALDFLAIAASFLSQPFTAFLVNVLAFLPFRRAFFRQSPFAAFCNWSPFASCNVQWISFQIYTGHDCVYSRIIFTIYLSTYLRIYQSIAATLSSPAAG